MISFKLWYILCLFLPLNSAGWELIPSFCAVLSIAASGWYFCTCGYGSRKTGFTSLSKKATYNLLLFRRFYTCVSYKLSATASSYPCQDLKLLDFGPLESMSESWHCCIVFRHLFSTLRQLLQSKQWQPIF